MRFQESKTYVREADLCADFIAAVKGHPRHGQPGWTWEAYPETCGWDILLVRLNDGFQIGVEAKLRLNVEVINQALERSAYWPTTEGPDCRAVLVPNKGNSGLGSIAAYIGVTVIYLREEKRWNKPPGYEFSPRLPYYEERWSDPDRDWYECCPTERHALPAYIPDSVAGSSSPIQLTDWKIRAIKIAIILEERPVTRGDFKEIRIDHRRWTAPGAPWLVPDATGRGWVAGPFLPDFRAQHPRNFEEIKAEAAIWMPKKGLLA